MIARLTWFILVLALLAGMPQLAAQTLIAEASSLGGQYRLNRPSSLALAPGGDQLAIADPGQGMIFVVDSDARMLWVAGEELPLPGPDVVWFESDNSIGFIPVTRDLVLSVNRDRPTSLDTLAFLVPSTPARRIAQVVKESDSVYVVLDDSNGDIRRISGENWRKEEVVIGHGPGPGRLLAPTALAVTVGGRLVVSDQKNLPAQIFDPKGRPVAPLGWDNPADQRGWIAGAVAVDSRNVIWVADLTHDRFRRFDPSGSEAESVAFPNPLFRPRAMAATVDNRVIVLGDTGSLLIYSLE